MKFSILFFFLLFVGYYLQAVVRPIPVISNFTDKDYNAKFQNWDISQDDKGRVCIANGDGVLIFNGVDWTCLPSPNGGIVRSVLCADKKIFIGTFEEFGSFNENKEGNFIYKSISSGIAEGESLKNEEIWKILPWKDKIIFQSFAHIYVYDPLTEKIEILTDAILGSELRRESYFSPLFSFVIGDNLYAQRINGTFYRYSSEGWIPLWENSGINNHIMGIHIPNNSVRKGSDDIPDGTLLFTQSAGIYKLTDGTPVRLSGKVDKELGETQINRVITDNDGNILIGTIGKGILHIDPEGNLLDVSNISSGLNNNTVLGLFKDQEQNIWVMLDDGISLIHKGVPIKLIHPYSKSFIYGLGTGYNVGKYKGRLIFASNQGAYIEDNQDFSLIDGTKGQNWFVETFDNQTFIGGNDQTVILEKNGSRTILPFSGTDIKKVRIHGKEILLQSTYYTFVVYSKDEEGNWKYSHYVDGVETPIRHIEAEPDGSIWASHWTKGLLKINLSKDLRNVERKIFFPSLTSSEEKAVFFINLRGKNIFNDGNGFFDFDETENKFIKADRLGILNSLSQIRNAWVVDDNTFWIAGADFYNLVEFNGKDYNFIYSIPLDIFSRKNNGENSSIFIDNDTTYFIVNNVIGQIDLRDITNLKPHFPLSINSIGSYNEMGKFIYLPLQDSKTPHTPLDNLSVVLSYPNYNGYPFSYKFSLSNGSSVLDSISSQPSIYYPELKWGKHHLSCTVLDINHQPVDEVQYEFYIDRPWPVRWWAILIYLVIFAVVIFFFAIAVSKWRLRKQKEKFEKEENEKNLKIHEQSLLIARQEKLLLESQLSEKSKELASIAFSEYGHNLALENIKASLEDLRKKGKEVNIAEKVLKEFSKNEGDSRVFWDIFEKNFDLIHQHFFRNLRKAYPSLTPADMKFCALLRMNMSTKEISRFTSLSVRGVETARYRLRKKFELSPDQSLVQFLIDFKD